MRVWLELERLWYRSSPPPLLLRPLAMLYGSIADRRAQRQQDDAQRLPVPVIVVGNVTVGGTGKTPCVLWLVQCLRELGWTPGVISRGYGGKGPFPRVVTADDDPDLCGDEPVLMARRAQVPLAVAPDRLAAGRCLLAEHPEVDVLVCDDGLQHYRLVRDLEFCVVDGARGWGNGWLLPAGPLREPPSRAAQAALILVNGADAIGYGDEALRFDLRLSDAINLHSGERQPLSSFTGAPVHAVAGIGNPQRFFNVLREHDLQVQTRTFPDHHRYRLADFAFAADQPVLMTEKDAVKCRGFPLHNLWAIPAVLHFDPAAEMRVRQCLQQALGAAKA